MKTLDQKISELTTLFKHDGAVAGLIVNRPSQGSAKHRQCRQAVKVVRREQEGVRRAPPDPFGRLLSAMRVVGPKLAPVANPINPNDPARVAQLMIWQIGAAIQLITEEEHIPRPDLQAENVMRRQLGMLPAEEATIGRRGIGYRVDVSAIDEARDTLRGIALNATGRDVRETLAAACSDLVEYCLAPISERLGPENAGWTLVYLHHTDPGRYSFSYTRKGSATPAS